MIKTNPENNLAKNSRKKFLTAQARRAHVRAYQFGNESMIAYCDKHNVVLSTLKSWVKKYGEKKMPAQFVPMLVSAKNTTPEISKTKSSFCCEIHVGDIKIIFPEISDVGTVIQLIRGVSHANPVKSSNNIVL